MLSSVYRDATERAFDRRLNLYLRTLIAEVATPDEPPDRQFQSLGEPLFELPLSGWYWQITRTDTDKPEVRASRSLWDKKLPKLDERGAELSAAGIRIAYVDGPEGQSLRMVERPVDLGADGKFLVGVAGDASEIFDETRSFDYYLGGTFTALGIVLLLTTIFQVRFGLAPLKRISDSIADIRSGRAERLEGEFPVEIAPLARETNALIDANREIVERARTHVGNLAHAIKTPLSVIVNEASAHGSDPFARKMLEQTDVMRDQVAHHLERARIAARVSIIGTVTEVAPAIEALQRTMEKIHRDRGIVIEVQADPKAKFRGERQDLEEMAGNLVDNACKWASSRVFIEVLVGPAEPGLGPTLRLIVDDDGRGLSAAERAQVSRRGQRLDESKPGSGLGTFDRGRSCRALRRQPVARQRTNRRFAGRIDATRDLAGLNHVREVAIAKRLLNARAVRVSGGGVSPSAQVRKHHRAHGPDIDRAAEGLSRAASAASAGAADAGVRTRDRARPGCRRRQPRAGTIAQGGAQPEGDAPPPARSEDDVPLASRSGDIARFLFRPIEPFLVDGNAPIRPGQIRRTSLMPIWQWLVRDGAPDQVREFEQALGRDAQGRDGLPPEAPLRKLQAAVADAIFQVTSPSGGDNQRTLSRIGAPNVIEDLLPIGSVLQARDALDGVAAGCRCRCAISRIPRLNRPSRR